jgi:hypothetical protein
MAALNFPASPSVDDLYTANGSTWKWDGTSWNVVPATALLSLLDDVSLTSVATDDILQYDGTDWVNTAGDLNTSVTVVGSDGTSDWSQASGSDPWIATKTVSGLLSTDRPIVDIDLSSVAYADVVTVQNAWATVYRVEASADDELKVYATAEPAPNFALLITVVR